jgi:class 3 adenylate cyclase/tetratricopeptide (TPR) repeat protein
MPNSATSQCGECGFHNDDRARFCASCGTNLHERCPQCGATVRARQNFCRVCGEPLSTIQAERPKVSPPEHLAKRISPVQAERKIATVLFADIVNSTEVIKDLDPEDAKRFLVPAVDIMTNAVHRYEGIVVRDRGDGVMASFGAPVALEDHAVRACYAALDMQNAIRSRADEIARDLGVPLEVRIGINSGPILVTVKHEVGGGREIRVDGVATHIAARLEPLATPGTILLSRETLALAEGYLHARPLGPRQLKSIEEPVQVYQLEGVNTRIRIQALAARRMSKFVGRQYEIEALRRRAAQAKSGRGQVVALVGDAGIGKSRVVLEFIHSDAMAGWQLLEAGSVSYGKATAYLPLVDLLTRYFDVQGRDNEDEVRGRIVNKLSAFGDEKLIAQTPFFLAALGMAVNNDAWTKLMPIERQRGMFDALKRLLIRESQQQPLCLVFEDLHWVDAETHSFLDTLVDSIPGARLLMLVNYRPEHQSRWAGRSHFSEFRLDPLPSESAVELLEVLLGSDAELDPLKQALIDTTEGNPLFLEESVRSLVESGMLAGTPDQRRSLGLLLSGFIPHTIEALLNSRIDRLQAEMKDILQCAAVIGYDIPRDLLEAVAGRQNDIEHSVRELQAAELLYEKTLFPDTVYSFKHAITREVVYASLTRERKTALHAESARAIVALAAGRIEEQVERVAQHAELGGLHDLALEYLERAGTKAYALYANREAADFFERALNILQQLPESRATLEHAVDLRFELRNALIALSELDRIRKCLEEIEAILARLGDKVRSARHAAFRCNHHFLAGAQRRAIEFGEAGLKLAQECGDRALQGELLYRVGQCFHLLGQNRRAMALLEQSLQFTIEQHERNRFELSVIPAVVSRTWLVSVLAECGDFRAGMTQAKRALEISEKAEHPLSQVLGWLSIGHVLRRKGEIDGAIGALERGMGLCGRYALPLWRLRLLSSLGIAYACSGRVTEGLELAQQALTEGESMELMVDQPMFLVHLGLTSLIGERTENALIYAKRALDLAMAHEGKGDEAWARFLIGRACLALKCDATEESRKELGTALDLAIACEARPLVAFCQTALGEIQSRCGETVEAQKLTAAADAVYKELDMRPLIINPLTAR